MVYNFKKFSTKYVEIRWKTTEPTTCEFELNRLSALRLSVWLLDDGQIQLSYRNQGFVFTLGAIQRKVFQDCIIADFQSRFAAAKGA